MGKRKWPDPAGLLALQENLGKAGVRSWWGGAAGKLVPDDDHSMLALGHYFPKSPKAANADVQALAQPRQAVDDVRAMGVQIAPVTADLVAAATLVSQQTGLLTNDALVVAVTQAHGLTHLASHDADFDRVPGIARYAPA
jgi:hypothetical protein